MHSKEEVGQIVWPLLDTTKGIVKLFDFQMVKLFYYNNSE